MTIIIIILPTQSIHTDFYETFLATYVVFQSLYLSRRFERSHSIRRIPVISSPFKNYTSSSFLVFERSNTFERRNSKKGYIRNTIGSLVMKFQRFWNLYSARMASMERNIDFVFFLFFLWNSISLPFEIISTSEVSTVR